MIASDPNHFEGNTNDSSMLIGALANVAIACADLTYEDSTLVSEKLADDLSTKVTFDKAVSISHNSNISDMKGVGDKIISGDPLLIYEEVFETDGSDVGKMLSKLGDEFGDVIDKYSKNSVPSKYSGNIIEMRIYYNRDLEEFSPSIRKFIETYIEKNTKKSKILKDCRRDHIVRIPTVEKINTNRIAGHEFDGLMIHYFIETEAPFIPGDKLAVGVALKSIVGGVMPKNELPFVIRGDKKIDIDLMLSPFSTASRMVPDAYLQGYLNKTLIALKDEIEVMLKEK